MVGHKGYACRWPQQGSGSKRPLAGGNGRQNYDEPPSQAMRGRSLGKADAPVKRARRTSTSATAAAVPTNHCRLCFKTGHWGNECPKRAILEPQNQNPKAVAAHSQAWDGEPKPRDGVPNKFGPARMAIHPSRAAHLIAPSVRPTRAAHSKAGTMIQPTRAAHLKAGTVIQPTRAARLQARQVIKPSCRATVQTESRSESAAQTHLKRVRLTPAASSTQHSTHPFLPRRDGCLRSPPTPTQSPQKPAEPP